MTKKTKILTLSLCLSSIAILPIVLTPILLNKQNKIINSKYIFDDKTFNSKADALAYATSNAENFSTKTTSTNRWSINVNNQTISFDSQAELLKYIEQFIDMKGFTSYTNEFQVDSTVGSIDPNELSKMNFNSEVKTTEIFRGKDNSIHKSELDAKNSYLQMHEVYYFDGIYFRTREELAVWLESNIEKYKDNSAKAYEITFQNIDGSQSMPIKIDELKMEYQKNPSADFVPAKVDNFVRTNAKPYYKYYDENLNKDIYFSSEDAIDKVFNNYEPNYVEINSNQGKGNYIVDLHTDDEAELFGPYYTKSGSEILQISDRSKWRKISGTDHQIVTEMQQNAIISKFMQLMLTTISESDKNRETPISKFALFEIPDIQNDINVYFEKLARDLPNIYYSLENIYNTMKQGKRYSEFLKTPILFMHTIDQMIYYSVEQEYIDQTKEIYLKIAKHFDEQLYSMVPEVFLLSKNNKKFSFVELFGINQKNLDLNYDIESKIGEIYYEYHNLYEFMEFILHTELFLTKLNTLQGIEFSFDFFEKSFGISLNRKFEAEYKLIWNVLNSKTSDEFLDNLSKINENSSPWKAEYYINNFISQQMSLHTSKIIITFWLDREHAIKTYNLTNDQIKQLDKIATPSYYNDAFKIHHLNNHKISRDTIFLKILFKIQPNINLVLFTRLITYCLVSRAFDKNLIDLFMDYMNNETMLLNKINEYISNHILTNYNNFSRLENLVLSRNNFTYAYTPQLSKEEIFPNFSPVNRIKIDLEKIKKIAEVFEKVIDGYMSLHTGIGQIINKADPSMAWENASTAISIIGSVLKMFSVNPFCLIASVICDFIANIYKEEKLSYIFETEDVKYIWNGGKQSFIFFGLVTKELNTIEDMKLLPPLQIIKPNNINGMYYNGKIYSTEDSLKTKQLDDILNNRYKSKNLEIVYSLIDLENSPNSEIDPKFFNYSVDNLAKSFSNHVKNTITSDQPIADKIIKESAFKFGTYTYDNNKTKKENIQNIINSIRPTLVAQTPILISGYGVDAGTPIYNNNDSVDSSIKTYKLPGKSWTASGGYQVNNDQNFIMVDQNPSDPQATKVDYVSKLKEQFYNSFDVQSKYIDETFIHSSNLYSDLSSKIESNFCYIATGRDNEKRIFLDKNLAINWLLAEYDLQTHTTTEIITTYFYNGLGFDNYQEFANWVYNNIKVEEK